MSTQPTVGEVFGRLTVVSVNGKSASGRPRVSCICACGVSRYFDWGNLKHSVTRSCGCLKSEVTRQRNRTVNAERNTVHGLSKSSEYKIWMAIKDRCLNQKSAAFKYYGGRGITICTRWQDSFDNFLLDVGRRPHKHLTLERLRNNKGYSPSNCVWATHAQQSRNKRSNRFVVFQGVRMVLKDAATFAGLPYATVCSRVRRGWPRCDWFTPATRTGDKS